MNIQKVYLQPIIIVFAYLLFMNNEEIFLVDQLEKGVKKYVEDKDRRDEILAVTSPTKKSIKDFNKLREEQVKEFREMNANRNNSREEFEQYFKNRSKERLEIQMKMIENRVRMHGKIRPDEWVLIMELEKKERQKKQDKIDKKLSKGKFISPLKGMEKAIDQVIYNESKKKVLRNELKSFESTHLSWVEKANNFSALHNEIIAKKDASKEELVTEITELNNLRMEMYVDIIDFRFIILENTNDKEWDDLINELNKIMRKQRILQ